jgi:hypothetical protein
MRFPAVVVSALLLLAGTFYFFARAKENPALGVRFDQLEGDTPVAGLRADRDAADEYDTALVRKMIKTADLAEDQTNTLVGAAGRRYMRRKLAYIAAKAAVDSGRVPPGGLDGLRQEMDQARKVCDVAESLGTRTRELGAMARADWEMERAYIPSTMMGTAVGMAERFDGSAPFTEADLKSMEQAFVMHFGKPLPVSARGETAVHRALGFDHRGRFDVAVSPSQPEGVWARRYLIDKHVSFFAFRGAVPGKATGAHIHIGPSSGHRGPRG